MKRSHTPIIILIFTILSLFIEGCSNQDILNSKNADSTMQSQNDRLTTEKDTTKDEIRLEQYLNYIWIVDEEKHGIISAPSFRIDTMDANIISGVVSSSSAYPNCFYMPEELLEYSPNLHGEVTDGIAECYVDGSVKGTITIEFNGKNSITAKIKHIEKGENRVYEEGTFFYRPYNVKDRDLFVENKKLKIETELKLWGEVQIISGQQESNHAVPVIFITDKDGNIYYQLGAPYPHDSSVKAVEVEDMNGDGRKDIRIITFIGDLDDSSDEYDFIWNFYQLENGWFWLERAGYTP